MTNPAPNDQPLWQVMEAAWESAPEVPMNQEGHCYAAELRALADIIERRGAKKLDLDPGETADWLRAEADRAEAGE